ncbi:MAG: cell envelope integrity protein CreD [Candidatus Gracilibacteria bacterium]|nr:cell envelope integrity protein CreD [Candidatus Gracilibacteria bacterium]
MNQSFLEKAKKTSIMTKILFIGILMLILLIPLGMITDLTYERESRFNDAVWEVSDKWGSQQQVIGPILSIPYFTETRDKDGKIQRTEDIATFLPEKLEVTGNIIPEVRSRGIFDVVLYKNALDFKTQFEFPKIADLNLQENNFLWDQATVSLGIPDMRGIKEDLSFNWQNQTLNFSPGADNFKLFSSGIHGKIPNLLTQRADSYELNFKINLNGSQEFEVAPIGKETTVAINSNWENPSFIGAFLPSEHDISEEGFTSNWEVSYFGRGYPQQWKNLSSGSVRETVVNSMFGVKLLIPIDFYQKNTRSIKYGILFILLTFTTFFLFEVLNKLKIHPLQYLFVGFSMCVFYLLLLSLSEHINFTGAYILSTIGTVSLISGYCMKILKNKARGLIMCLLTSLIYIYLFILLQLEDYALLIGSLSLFGVLATVMYLTRNIDWYQVKEERS